jgi:hypothetical protein
MRTAILFPSGPLQNLGADVELSFVLFDRRLERGCPAMIIAVLHDSFSSMWTVG